MPGRLGQPFAFRHRDVCRLRCAWFHPHGHRPGINRSPDRHSEIRKWGRGRDIGCSRPRRWSRPKCRSGASPNFLRPSPCVRLFLNRMRASASIGASVNLGVAFGARKWLQLVHAAVKGMRCPPDEERCGFANGAARHGRNTEFLGLFYRVGQLLRLSDATDPYERGRLASTRYQS